VPQREGLTVTSRQQFNSDIALGLAGETDGDVIDLCAPRQFPKNKARLAHPCGPKAFKRSTLLHRHGLRKKVRGDCMLKLLSVMRHIKALRPLF